MTHVEPVNGTNATTKPDPDAKDQDKLKMDPKGYENGPTGKRSCTDCLCCLLFIAFCVGMVGAASYGYANGDPYKLLTVWDYDGNGCGHDDTTLAF